MDWFNNLSFNSYGREAVFSSLKISSFRDSVLLSLHSNLAVSFLFGNSIIDTFVPLKWILCFLLLGTILESPCNANSTIPISQSIDNLVLYLWPFWSSIISKECCLPGNTYQSTTSGKSTPISISEPTKGMIAPLFANTGIVEMSL